MVEISFCHRLVMGNSTYPILAWARLIKIITVWEVVLIGLKEAGKVVINNTYLDLVDVARRIGLISISKLVYHWILLGIN